MFQLIRTATWCLSNTSTLKTETSTFKTMAIIEIVKSKTETKTMWNCASILRHCLNGVTALVDRSAFITLSVCISVPLWQIRIFGLFLTPNPDIRILSGFFVQVYIGPYILFCNIVSDTGDVGLLMKIKRHGGISKRLRDGVMCFELQIHSWWMMKTHWRAQSQRSYSGGPTQRTK